jgi:hypothetical protein
MQWVAYGYDGMERGDASKAKLVAVRSSCSYKAGLTIAGCGDGQSSFLSERKNSPRTFTKRLGSSAIMKWPVSNFSRREPGICS